MKLGLREKVSRYMMILAVVMASFSLAPAYASLQINICIPDKSVPPFYVISDGEVTGKTIDLLESLFAKNEFTSQHLHYKFTLQPWPRCLVSLKDGDVDMLVAGYSQERASFAVYPQKMGLPDEESVFSFTDICLIKRNDSDWVWDGKRLSGLKYLLLGVEPGFLVPQSHPEIDLIRYSKLWFSSPKYQLVLKKRMDAVLTVCGVMGREFAPEDLLPEGLTLVRPSFFSSPVYLVFSDAFYLRHSDIAKLIVKTSSVKHKKVSD